MYNETEVKRVADDQISQANPVPVTVVPLNPDVIRTANATPYGVRQLPEWFFDVPTARTQGVGAVPRPTAQKSGPSFALPTRLPNDLTPQPYRVGITDVIIIRTTPSAPDEPGPFNGGFQGFEIGADGLTDLPQLGSQRLLGLTTEEIEQTLNDQIAARGQNQKVDVRVSEYKSSRVSISGAVRNPLLASLNQKPLFLDEALQIAGGTTTRDPENTVIRIYRGNESYQIMENRLYGDDLPKIPMQNDDRIYVEHLRQVDEERVRFEQEARRIDQQQRLADIDLNRRRSALADARNNYLTGVNLGGVYRDYVYIAGAVSVQGRFTLPFDQGAVVADALYFEARGLERRDGDPKHIYVIRGSDAGDNVVAYWLDTRNAANLMLATRLELRPKDVIFGSNQPITDWNRAIEQILPTFSLVNLGADVRLKSADTRLRLRDLSNN